MTPYVAIGLGVSVALVVWAMVALLIIDGRARARRTGA